MSQIRLTEGAAPSAPSAGKVALYFKTDGFFYIKDDAGTETKISLIAGTDYLAPSAIGATVQAYDADLSTWAGVTPAAGITNFLTTPSSLNLKTAVTDETGSGSLVFATSPTLVTPILGVATGTSFQGIIGNVTPAAGTFTTLTSTGNAALGDAEATDTHAIKGATTILSNSASAALTVTNTGSGNSFVVEDAASTDTTVFTIDANGDVGAGVVPSANAKLNISKTSSTASTPEYGAYILNTSSNTTGATTKYGVQSLASAGAGAAANTMVGGQFDAVQSAAVTTTALTGVLARAYTNAAGTITGSMIGIQAVVANGSAATVSGSGIGFYVNDFTVGAASYGFFSNISSAAGKWNFYAAGTASNYFAGLIDISASTAGQIKFPATQNASADANTLDDYEEGTFTPTITFGGAAVGVTYTTQIGRYTKIGREVFYRIYLILSSKGSSVGNSLINALPFTSSGDANYASALRLGTVTSGVGDTYLQAYVIGSSSTIQLTKLVAGTQTVLPDTDITNTTAIALSGHYFV
jgi:hypothetical protein